MPYLSSSPHLHSGSSTERIMLDVLIALAPASLVAVVLFGWPALLVLVLAVGGCLATEAVCQLAMKRPLTLRDNSAAITGVLLALNLPPSLPWWMVLLGAVIAILIGKQIYGGLGYNPFNPALVARVVLLISFPVQMTRWTAPEPFKFMVDGVSAATPLGEMKSSVMLSGKLPEALQAGYSDYLFGAMSGCIGEVSAVALLIGAAYLFWRKVISWHIPVTFLGTAVLMSGVFWLVDGSRYPSPVFHLLTGGMLLGAFFMATDMVTSPITPRGMIVFGVGCGVLTILIRLFGGYPEGVSFAILLMNAATPLIDRFTRPKVFGYRGETA
ncbi:MAG: electron transporter RnfD [Desulfuromonas sp.]|nr:MAG: electron transporter RnfD [Desulfuromonas sp.]